VGDASPHKGSDHGPHSTVMSGGGFRWGPDWSRPLMPRGVSRAVVHLLVADIAKNRNYRIRIVK